jgi:hypothetical protein
MKILLRKMRRRISVTICVTVSCVSRVLERKVVGRFGGREGTLIGRGHGSSLGLRSRSGLRGCGLLTLLTIRALAQELEGIYHHLGSITLVAGLVGPLTGAETAFHKDLRAFVDVFFCHVGIITPQNEVVPFGVFADFSVAVTVTLRGSKRERSHLGIGGRILGIGFEVTYFRVFSNVTDEHDFVQ